MRYTESRRVQTADLTPLAVGCMRLSTDPDRDEERAAATLHAALDAGVTLLDTADAYAWDESETGHNERLIARALGTWTGDASRIRVATKGGLTRPGGRWEPDGRGRHLLAACQASLRALGVARIHLYQLHAPDPRTPLATSVRALAALQRDGLVERIGLCNVSVAQIEDARRIAPIAAVQVELSPWHDATLRGGVAELCAAEGIGLLAHRPLGGAGNRARLARDPLLVAIGDRHGATAAEVVLAWLRGLAPVVVPLPGPTRPETARSAGRVGALRLSEEDVAQLDARFPAARLLRVPRAARRPREAAPGDVVLVMGLPGAGKSTLAAALVAQGYARLNRDQSGGRLSQLVPALARHLAAGQRHVVLDNTYGARAARNDVIEAAWAHGVPVRCLWLQTGLEDAQVNVVQRLLARYGRLLGPEDLKQAARDDPGALTPAALFRHRREIEPPDTSEGFVRVEPVPFVRRPAGHAGRAALFWHDGVLRKSRSGARTPSSPDDVVVPPGRREAVARYRAEGFRVLGVAWQPEIVAGRMTDDEAGAIFARTHELLGTEMETVYCPHGDGPPVCWCRKPLPGLAVVLIERHRLDPARCVYVGRGATDQAFARAVGFTFRHADEVFGLTPAPAVP
jgi:aryl-alcohol dehydrogenase-like predicted oxidoreductase/histidinol phosphatase-like enzyme/predicted kinase